MSLISLEENGGAGRNRTDDLYNAIVALSQLSYGPKIFKTVRVAGFPARVGGEHRRRGGPLASKIETLKRARPD